MPNELPSFFQDIADASPTPTKDYSKHEDMADTFRLRTMDELLQKVKESEVEHLDQTLEDPWQSFAIPVTRRIFKQEGRLPQLDPKTMPRSINVDQRDASFDDRFNSTYDTEFNRRPMNLEEGNPHEDIKNLTDYLNTMHNAPADQPLPTHPVETDNTLNRLMSNFTAGKLWEWGAYAAGNMANPKVGPAMNAMWMAAWIMAGHDLRNETIRQVREGKSISEIRYPKGGITDLGGIISGLQERYGKKPEVKSADEETKPEEGPGAQYASSPNKPESYTQEELDNERQKFRDSFEKDYPAVISPRINDMNRLFDIYDEERKRWFDKPLKERIMIRSNNLREKKLDEERFKMSPEQLRRSLLEEEDKAKLKEEANKIKKNNQQLLK